jgi:hypothetical protein
MVVKRELPATIFAHLVRYLVGRINESLRSISVVLPAASSSCMSTPATLNIVDMPAVCSKVSTPVCTHLGAATWTFNIDLGALEEHANSRFL